MFSSKEKTDIWKKLADLGQTMKADKKELINLINANESISQKDAAQASKKTSEYRNKANDTYKESLTALSEVKVIKNNIIATLEGVNASEIMLNETIGQQKEYLIQIKEIAETINMLEDNSSEAMEKINEIISERDEIESEVLKFKEAVVENEDSTEKIQHVLNQTVVKKKEIDLLHQELFGFDNEDEHINGKKDDLEDIYLALKAELSELKNNITEYEKQNKNEFTQLSSVTLDRLKKIENDSIDTFEKFTNESQSTYDDTLKKIEDLLPASLTAGLATAYNEKIKTENKESKSHKTSFLVSIGLLITISLIPFLFGAYRLQGPTDLATVIQDMPNLLAIILPVYFPVVWLAYSANKSYKLSKRLIEEYTHKGVLSKTFEGLSTQIKDLNQEDISAELRVKLLYNLVDVNSENPGKLISDYNKSDHPLMDALDKSAKLANSFEKLGKLPGFSALAKKMDEKLNVELKKKDEKISGVINSSGEQTDDISKETVVEVK